MVDGPANAGFSFSEASFALISAAKIRWHYRRLRNAPVYQSIVD
jgi:hypothetical protein